MPTYNFIDTETNERFEKFMKISELDEYLKSNPSIKQLPSTPGICDPVRIGVRKPDSSFRDLLIRTKNAHKHSTLNP